MPNFLQCFVDEAGMTRFIAAHEAKELVNIGIFDLFLDFGVKHAAGKFGGQRTHQEIDEFRAQALGQTGKIEVKASVRRKCALLWSARIR